MAENKISAAMTAAEVTAFKTDVDGVKALVSFTVSLTAEERDRLRVMGDKSMGYVDKVFVGLSANTDSIPGSFSMAEFSKDMALLLSLKDMVGYVLFTLLQPLQDTEMQLRHELIKQADIGYSILQTAEKNGDPNAREAVAAIRAVLKHAALPPEETVFDIAMAGITSVSNTVPGQLVVNLGSTVLSVATDPELSGILRPPVALSPGNSYELPVGWIAIKVTNMSQDTQGKFSTKISRA